VGTKKAQVGTITKPLRMDSLEVNPSTRALLDKLEHERHAEFARVDQHARTPEEIDAKENLTSELNSRYPSWLRKPKDSSGFWRIVRPSSAPGPKETEVVMGNLNVSPDIFKGRKELLKQRRRVEISNNRFRFRHKFKREPSAHEAQTGRPDPIGGAHR
jgi:hypothetical protein